MRPLHVQFHSNMACGPEQRQADMMAAVGVWKDREDLADSEAYVRNLRKGTRLQRLGIV